MNRAALQVFAGFLILVGLAAGLLVRVRTHLVLGRPGVKVVAAPLYNEDTNLVATTSVYLPATVPDYSSVPLPITKLELGWLPPDTVYGRRLYSATDGFKTQLSVVLMGSDRTSIHKPQYCLTGAGEQIVGSEVVSVPMAKPSPYELKVMKLTTRSEISSGGQFVPVSGLFLYWFVTDGALTPYHEKRMWLMGREMFTTGTLQRWAYIAYFAHCQVGHEAVLLERMKRFIAATVPEFQTTPSAADEKVALMLGGIGQVPAFQ